MIERTRLSYSDLRVTLHRPRIDNDTVTVSVFAGNNADNSVDVSFKKSTFWDDAGGDRTGFLDLLESGAMAREDLFVVGEELARIALPTNAAAEGEFSVRDQFMRAEAAARATDAGAVRIRLAVFDRMLAQLPWEYMAIKQSSSGWRERDFLALRRRVSIVRAGPAVAAQLRETGNRLNITALLANPGAPFRTLDLGKDRDALDNAAGEMADDGAAPVTVTYVSPPTVARLVPAVDDETHVFYFGGHGQLEGDTTNLILENDEEGAGGDAYSATLLGQLLAGRRVRLAFLGACDTGRLDGSSPWAGAADELMKAEVPFVVAYQAAVLDTAASLAARHVWRYCMSGFAIDQAIADARTEMLHTLREAPAEWGKVVLYLAEAAGDQVFFVETEDDAVRLQDVLSDEFAAWLASRTASTKTTLYRSAVAEVTHDLVALEAEVDEFEDQSVADRLESPYRPFRHFTYPQRRLFEREDLSARVAAAFRETQSLLVSGPAGSGKTSLLLAGLGPEIVADGHALIRVADYADLAGRLAVDLSDLGLADLPDSTDMETVLNALERDPPPVPPVVILDQLEQLADPQASPGELLEENVKRLLRAARNGLVRLVLATRSSAETHVRGLILGEHDLDWKPVQVPYLTHEEAIAAIRRPPARLEKTIHYVDGIPERIATELNPHNEGVQPGLLSVVCDRLWHDTRQRGPEGSWAIDKPAEGGVGRVLATALDRFLDEELAGLSDAAQEVLGSADLFEATPWTQLDQADDTDHAQAIERLVQLGLLARRTRTRRVIEYRYAGPAVRDLVVFARPWTVRRRLDAQETLTSIRLDWKRGLMPSRGHLAYIAASADQLHPDLEECTLLIRASLEHRLDPTVWVDRAASLSSAGEGNPAVAAVDAPGTSIDHESESGRLLGVPDGTTITPPPNVGPYTWWAIHGPDRTGRLTAGLVASLHDFGGRLNEAAFGSESGDRRSRRRLRQLWAALDDAGRLDAADVASLGSLDRVMVSAAKAWLRISRSRRELGIHSRSVGLAAGLLLGLLQMLNWLLLDWPSWTRLTESLGEFFAYFLVGGLLGAALGAGMQLPKVLGRNERGLTFLSGATAFAVMSILLELSDGREFWRRPMITFAMAVAGTIFAGAALWPTERTAEGQRLPRWRGSVSASTAVAAAAVAVLHWVVRLPDDAVWQGRLLFAKWRDNYFEVFNQLHDSEAPVAAIQFLVMSLVNTTLAGLIIAGAARFGRRAAEEAVEEIRRTEERVPADDPAAARS